MYQKKIFSLNETQLRHIQELIKSPSFVTLCEWADWEYNEWCKYWMSLIPHLDLLKEEDKQSMEKEYYANVAVNEWLDRIRQKWTDYIWTPV